MAKIKQCKTCKKDVSISAKVCPHCGEPYPTGKKTSIFTWFVLFLIVFVIYKCGTTPESGNVPKTPEEQALIDYKNACSNNYKACKDNADIVNINTEVSTEIKVSCKRAAEKEAISTVDWGGFLSPNFGIYGRGDSGIKEDKILVVDDVAMYQNEFGSKIKRKTYCLYNLKTKSVEKLSIE